ncbi:22589_t:CDS:2, partial [Rhizophagus irregularis]
CIDPGFQEIIHQIHHIPLIAFAKEEVKIIEKRMDKRSGKLIWAGGSDPGDDNMAVE